MKILYGTTYVSEDEPCLSLREMNEMGSDLHGDHRYQIIRVIRDSSKVTEFRWDMGNAKKFTAGQFIIPGGVRVEHGKTDIVHNVGELREIADYLRAGAVKIDLLDRMQVEKAVVC